MTTDTTAPGALPLVPPTPDDRAHLADCKAEMHDGYDDDRVSRVLGPIQGARIVCVWNVLDTFGFTGDSQFVGRARDAAGNPTGPWRTTSADLWSYLNVADSDIDLEQIDSLLSDELYEFQDIDSLPGDGNSNVALGHDDGRVPDAGDKVLYKLTVADAEAILGRPVEAGEADRLRKTLEFALGDAASDAVMTHGTADDLDDE